MTVTFQDWINLANQQKPPTQTPNPSPLPSPGIPAGQNVQQRLLTNKFSIKDFTFEPAINSYNANNFVQRAINYNFSFDETLGLWRPQTLTTEGVQEVSATLQKREAAIFTIFTDEVIPNQTLATHLPIDVSDFGLKTFYLKSTASVTAHFQFSDDAVLWYDWVDLAGTAININVNNNSKAMAIDDWTRYIRLIIENNSGGNATIIARLGVAV